MISMSQSLQSMKEATVQNHNDKHPFDLLWTELEGASSRQIPASKLPPVGGGPAAFDGIADPALISESWSDSFRNNALYDQPHLYSDAMAPHPYPRMEQEPNPFDLSEQLLSRQLQQQQNLLSLHAQLVHPSLEHMPNENLALQQQLANHPVPELEHIMALKLQHQFQQQQPFHQQHKLLQEQQESQLQQILLERLLQNRRHDHTLGQSHVDPIRANSVLDQILLEQQLLQELQHHSRHPSGNSDPYNEQLIQAQFGHVPQHELQRDLLLSHDKLGPIQSLDHQLLKEQLQARQSSLGLGWQNNMQDKRTIGSLWPGEEAAQFLRTNGARQAHASGFSPLDIFQRQSGLSWENQMSYFERNQSLQEHLRQEIYEPDQLPFEQSMSLPTVNPGINLDIANVMAQFHGLDMEDSSLRVKPIGRAGAFPLELHAHKPHHPSFPSQFHVPRPDAVEGYWPENDNLLQNDWLESQIQQLHVDAERKKWGAEGKMPPEGQCSWMSDAQNDIKSKQLLMELLNQKSGRRLDVSDESERRPSSVLYSGLSSSDLIHGRIQDRESGSNNTFTVGSYGSSSSEPPQYYSDERNGGLESKDNLSFGSDLGNFNKGEHFLLGHESAHGIYGNPSVTSKLPLNRDLLKSDRKELLFEIHDSIAKQTGLAAAVEHGELPSNAFGRHSSLGNSSDALLCHLLSLYFDLLIDYVGICEISLR